jgi:tetratricopeptide (TPR) repeat protein
MGYIYLGQLYERLKRNEDALTLYKQALLVEPRNADVLRSFAELIQRIHGPNKVKELAEYEKFVNEYPVNSEVRRIFAQRLESEENFEDAIQQYEQILQADPENIEALVSLGKVYAQTKNYDKAGEVLSKAVEISPENIELYDAVASTYLAKEDSAQATALYRKAIEANPSAEKLYISLAALLESEEKTTDAVTVMEEAVAKVGAKPELLAVLGKFYRSLGQPQKAVSTLREAYEKESGNLPLFGELISLYLEEENTTAAEEITSRTANSGGVAKDVVLSVAAEFYFNSGRSEKAMELYLLTLRENPGKLEYLARLVGIGNRQKLFDRSLAYVEEFGGKIKEQEKVEQLKAEIYLASGQFSKAIAIYKALVSKNPLDLNYYQYLVDAYNEAKRYNESVKLLEEIRKKFNSSDPEAVLMMTGMVYYKQEKFAQAEKAFLNLIKRTDGKNDDAYYFLGSVYLDQERYAQAEKQFRKAIEVNPTSANALNALGYMFADRGVKLDEAKELVSQALDVNPTAPHILDSMGWVLFKEGDLKGAEEYVERASRQYQDAEIFSHLAEIYEKQGRLELAKQMYERALELDPDRRDLKQKLTTLSGNGAR